MCPSQWPILLSRRLSPSFGALAISALLSFGAVQSLAELGTYVSDETAEQIEACIDVIPDDASVAATDSLLPHLSDRRPIYEVTTKSDTDYIAIDVSTLGALNPVDAQLRSVISTSLGGAYGVACSKGLTVVLARGSGSTQLSDQMRQWLEDTCLGSACPTLP